MIGFWPKEYFKNEVAKSRCSYHKVPHHASALSLSTSGPAASRGPSLRGGPGQGRSQRRKETRFLNHYSLDHPVHDQHGLVTSKRWTLRGLSICHLVTAMKVLCLINTSQNLTRGMVTCSTVVRISVRATVPRERCRLYAVLVKLHGGGITQRACEHTGCKPSSNPL